MRIVIQRVSRAKVQVDQQIIGEINKGLLLLVGIEEDDTAEDINWCTRKIAQMRLFNDEEGKMNKSLLEIDGEVLSVSQFTLHASTKKGNRPSFIKAAKPEKANHLYLQFNETLTCLMGKEVATGIFGAHMEVSLINDGPVTILLDSKNKE